MKLKYSAKCLSMCVFLFSSLPAQSETIVNRTYEFIPNKPVTIENPLFWEISILCTVETVENENTLIGVMRKNGAEINGQRLKEGQSLSMLIKNRDTLAITTDMRAKVEITNLSQSTVIARCKI